MQLCCLWPYFVPSSPLQERAELKERARIAEEAEAERKNRVTVTVDLLGRRVLMAQEAEPSAATSSAASDAAAAAAATSREIPQVCCIFEAAMLYQQLHVRLPACLADASAFGASLTSHPA